MIEEEITLRLLKRLVKEAISEITVEQVDKMIDHCLQLMIEEEERLNQ